MFFYDFRTEVDRILVIHKIYDEYYYAIKVMESCETRQQILNLREWIIGYLPKRWDDMFDKYLDSLWFVSKKKKKELKKQLPPRLVNEFWNTYQKIKNNNEKNKIYETFKN